MTNEEKSKWLATRKEAGLQIDPKTAEVHWGWGQICDPYGIDPDLPEEYDCIGRIYFARSPGSGVWVSFDDLPEATREAFWDPMTLEAAAERSEAKFWYNIDAPCCSDRSE